MKRFSPGDFMETSPENSNILNNRNSKGTNVHVEIFIGLIIWLIMEYHVPKCILETCLKNVVVTLIDL